MVAPLAACALGMQGMVLSNKATENPNAVLLMLFHEFAFNISATPLGLCVYRSATNSAALGRNSPKAVYTLCDRHWDQSGSLGGMPILVTGETWHFKSPVWIFDLRVLHLKGF